MLRVVIPSTANLKKIPAMTLLNAFLPTSTPSPLNRATTVSDDVAHTRRPAHALAETDESYLLTIDLPGVTKDTVTVTAEDGVLTVTGGLAWRRPEAWTPLHLESADAGYALAFAYEDAIDTDKISAAFSDGVLRLALPKSESRKPRKIVVN